MRGQSLLMGNTHPAECLLKGLKFFDKKLEVSNSRLNILANSDPPGGGRNKQIFENDKGFLLFSTKKRGRNKEK